MPVSPQVRIVDRNHDEMPDADVDRGPAARAHVHLARLVGLHRGDGFLPEASVRS